MEEKMVQNNLKQNLSLVEKLFDDVFTKGNLNSLSKYFNEDIIVNRPITTGAKGGIEGLKNKELQYKNGFPNKQVSIDEIFGSEEKVVVRWTTQGTHKGEFKGVAPTNRNIKMSGISVYEFDGGKISFIYQNWDRITLFEQIGVLDESTAALYQ
jgi:steroid delta-isomerase-like uncharacterized protein